MFRTNVLARVAIVIGFCAPSVHAFTYTTGLASATLAAPSVYSLPGTECGGPLDNVCPSGEFCKFPAGVCNDQTISGVCTERPDFCITLWDPVCGCDGNTYSNSCDAGSFGVSIDYIGECIPVCGGALGTGCAATEFCVLPVGSCDSPSTTGICTFNDSNNVSCLTVVDPVCGCDGNTYGNDCEALLASVNIDHTGECTQTAAGAIPATSTWGVISMALIMLTFGTIVLHNKAASAVVR